MVGASGSGIIVIVLIVRSVFWVFVLLKIRVGVFLFWREGFGFIKFCFLRVRE